MASLRRCASTVLARMDVGHLLLPETRSAKICVIRCLSLIVSDVCLKLVCSQSTGAHSALEVSHFMRCINSQLLTYLVIEVGLYACKTTAEAGQF